MKHFILGTAGHVDHGKSSLIQALTDVNTDRLPEEKERGLSIDLGFAPLRLESEEGESVHLGVVDVPGHHRFLRNMIAGVGGFDAALLVVDCCEGVKPQTKEHLKILELLQTQHGVVALSKADKIDEDGLEIARWELEELLSGTFLEGAAIVPTSAHTGAGLDELKTELYKLFVNLEERNRQGVARLPVDRAFSKTGFGDVITGSLWSGTLRVGDDVELLPMGAEGKVRGLQVHGETAEEAYPGQRVAVNISGLSKGEIKRGQSVIAPRGSFPLARYFAASVTLLEPEPKLLQKKGRATFFQGTSHTQISLHLMADKETDTEVFGQLQFAEPVLLCRGDRFLLRDETDQRLLAGGTILAPEEKAFRRRDRATYLSRSKALAGGGEVGRALQFIEEKGGFCKESELKKHQGLSKDEWEQQYALLLESGKVKQVGKDKLWSSQKFDDLATRIVDLLKKLVEAARWKGGWKPQEIASLLQMKSGKEQGLDDVLELLVESSTLLRRGPLYAPFGHVPSLPKSAKKQADRIVELLEGDKFSPRNWSDCLDEVARNDKKLQSMLEDFLFGTEATTRISDKLVTTPNVLEQARERLAAQAEEEFTASEARQVLDTSRKCIIPILEWMDRQGWTVRMGDGRKLAPR